MFLLCLSLTRQLPLFETTELLSCPCRFFLAIFDKDILSFTRTSNVFIHHSPAALCFIYCFPFPCYDCVDDNDPGILILKLRKDQEIKLKCIAKKVNYCYYVIVV
jgi:hypothetical protein